MIFNKRRSMMAEEEATDYWISYSDLMAGVLLTVILFLFVAILNYKDTTSILEIQQNQLSDQKVKLEEQQQIIEDLVGIKRNIITDLIEVMKEANIDVQIDERTGDIILGSSVFFDHDSFLLKPSGQEFLKQFFPIYISVLARPDNHEFIGEIIIEGHTDNDGEYLYNLELSQKRALEVSKYIYKAIVPNLKANEVEVVMKLLTSNGKSFSQLIANSDGTTNMEASRRVEFKFSLKDTEVIDEINQIIGGQ